MHGLRSAGPPRHIGDAVMDDTVHLVSWIIVVGRMRGLEAAALINGYIHDHGALAHGAQHGAAYQLRCTCAGNEHRADNDVRGKHLVLNGVNRREPGTNAPFE